MTNKQLLIPSYAMKALKIAVFVAAIFLINTTANAQIEAGKKYQIISLHSNKCVDVSEVSLKNGQTVWQYKCLQTDNQSWEFVLKGKAAGISVYEIKARHSGKCLDVNAGGTANGTAVIQWDCHGGANQSWAVFELGGGIQIRPFANNKKCLDVAGPSTADGAKLQIWDCGGAEQTNQIFKLSGGEAASFVAFTPDSKMVYKIIEGTNGERLAVGSDDNVLRWRKTGGNEQKWRFVASTKFPGRYTIQSLKYQTAAEVKVLDVQWQTGNVSIYQPNDKQEQTFTMQKLTDLTAKAIVPDLYAQYKELGVDFVFIQEWSRDGKERVAIGIGGRARRWAASNDKNQVFILRKEAPEADSVRMSYDAKPFVTVKQVFGGISSDTNKRTIYNPLDGGVLLEYTQKATQDPGDGCSGKEYTTEEWRNFFYPACFAHDINYDAPFDKAEFPRYAGGKSTGEDISDFLFLQDMLKQKNHDLSFLDTYFVNLGGAPDWLKQNLVETAAFVWYRAVLNNGVARDQHRSNQEILQKGGAVAVKNTGDYLMGLRVSWTAPNGADKSVEVLNHGGQAAVIPLSVGATNIDIECWSVAGRQIFKRENLPVGMYKFTVGGKLHNFTLTENELAGNGEWY